MAFSLRDAWLSLSQRRAVGQRQPASLELADRRGPRAVCRRIRNRRSGVRISPGASQEPRTAGLLICLDQLTRASMSRVCPETGVVFALWVPGSSHQRDTSFESNGGVDPSGTRTTGSLTAARSRRRSDPRGPSAYARRLATSPSAWRNLAASANLDRQDRWRSNAHPRRRTDPRAVHMAGGHRLDRHRRRA